ncbi:hypothetical protein NE865_02242 [Phthorimaea operculella]|nr:hypothetical protein NE865_02242 [Phthorimaea operculella]
MQNDSTVAGLCVYIMLCMSPFCVLRPINCFWGQWSHFTLPLKQALKPSLHKWPIMTKNKLHLNSIYLGCDTALKIGDEPKHLSLIISISIHRGEERHETETLHETCDIATLETIPYKKHETKETPATHFAFIFSVVLSRRKIALSCCTFNLRYCVGIKAQCLIHEEDKKASGSSGSSGAGQTPSVKLPIISLPEFDGSFDHWLEYRDTFQSLVHKCPSISKIQKFHYLKSTLKGSAQLVVDSIEFAKTTTTLHGSFCLIATIIRNF